jgi:hypothetical protein
MFLLFRRLQNCSWHAVLVKLRVVVVDVQRTARNADDGAVAERHDMLTTGQTLRAREMQERCSVLLKGFVSCWRHYYFI